MLKTQNVIFFVAIFVWTALVKSDGKYQTNKLPNCRIEGATRFVYEIVAYMSNFLVKSRLFISRFRLLAVLVMYYDKMVP